MPPHLCLHLISHSSSPPHVAEDGRSSRNTPASNAPFYHCGIDVFGPFGIKDGKETRGKSGTRKLWVLIFSCLYSRAIHMEPLDHMDTASFKMAFERFQANRGECAYLRSDAGSNFIGARNQDIEILEDVINEVQSAWQQQNKIWDINPPHASHMGGAWERAIGQVRQVMQGYLLPKEERKLTREEFDTMIRHCAEIVNSTPLFDPLNRPTIPNQ